MTNHHTFTIVLRESPDHRCGGKEKGERRERRKRKKEKRKKGKRGRKAKEKTGRKDKRKEGKKGREEGQVLEPKDRCFGVESPFLLLVTLIPCVVFK